MPCVNLVYLYYPNEPYKRILVCSLDDGFTFMDPLQLFAMPDHDPYKVNNQGLYALGGKIDAETLIASYSWGIFPWYAYKQSEEIDWYCPEERYVIFPDKIHVGHSLRNLLNKKRYHITVNRCFEEVIHNCRYVDKRDDHEQAWLNDELERSFIELHKMGYAKSVEVWEGDELAGGFYGFFINGVFEGDSMFSLRPSASQIGLVELCRNPYIEGEKIKLIDTQFETPTFKRLGGEYISYARYRRFMKES